MIGYTKWANTMQVIFFLFQFEKFLLSFFRLLLPSRWFQLSQHSKQKQVLGNYLAYFYIATKVYPVSFSHCISILGGAVPLSWAFLNCSIFSRYLLKKACTSIIISSSSWSSDVLPSSLDTAVLSGSSSPAVWFKRWSLTLRGVSQIFDNLTCGAERSRTGRIFHTLAARKLERWHPLPSTHSKTKSYLVTPVFAAACVARGQEKTKRPEGRGGASCF